MRKLCFCLVLLLGMAVVPVLAEYSVELAGVTVKFSVPKSVEAYSDVPVECEISGSGEATVQAVATNSAAVEKYFDTAIPHKMAFRFELISQSERVAKFKVTNTGDTIWKADG